MAFSVIWSLNKDTNTGENKENSKGSKDDLIGCK